MRKFSKSFLHSFSKHVKCERIKRKLRKKREKFIYKRIFNFQRHENENAAACEVSHHQVIYTVAKKIVTEKERKLNKLEMTFDGVFEKMEQNGKWSGITVERI